MSFASLLLLAVGLAMDATAVSATRGLAVSRVLLRHVVLVVLFFGGSQALMPLAGWLVGARVGSLVRAWDHWIAFTLLVAIGGHMLWDARGDDHRKASAHARDPFALGVMAVLAVATSIDAFAIGVTLPMLDAPLVLSIVTIGVTTGILSAVGLYAGRRFGAILGKRLDALGGVILIGLGTKILFQHLTA